MEEKEKDMNLLNEINSILSSNKKENGGKNAEQKKLENEIRNKDAPEIRNFLANRNILNNVKVEYGKQQETILSIE